MLKKYFHITLIIFGSITAHSQGSSLGAFGSGVNDFTNVSGLTSGVWMTSGSSSSKIKGSPYLFEDWETSAVVVTKNQKKYKISKVNYDAKLDQIVAKISNDSVFSFNPSGIDKVIINNREFNRYLDPDFRRNSYFEVIVSTKEFEILKRNKKVVKEGVFNPMTQKKQSPDSYILEHKYFIRSGGALKELGLNKNKILKVFGDKQSEVKKFIKTKKLSVKDDHDLKRMFIYYDSL